MANGLILTGCAGFIGINTLLKIDTLKDKYNKIISIDKLDYSTTYNKEMYNELCSSHGIQKIDVNILELSNVIKFDKYYDWDILDFASSSHVDNSIKNPFRLYEENSLLPSRLLAAFEDLSSIRSYYHISTDEVYGDLPLDVKKENWFDIDSKFHPNNPYSASKTAQDCFLMSMKHTFKLPIRIIRMANQFGMFQHPEKMLPASCLRAFNDQDILIYGLGLNMRQWTPVDITAQIILDKVKAQEDFDILHIANKNGLVSNNTVVDILCGAIQTCTNIKPRLFYAPDRKGHDLCYALKTTPDIDNYFKDVVLEDYIADAAEFYFMKKDEYK